MPKSKAFSIDLPDINVWLASEMDFSFPLPVSHTGGLGAIYSKSKHMRLEH
jgi:hypothetical protein